MTLVTYLVFGALIVAWTAAWIIKEHLDVYNPWYAAGVGSFFYWTAAKLLLWILPAAALLRLSGRSLWSVLNLRNWRAWLAWGGGLGMLLGATGIIANYWEGKPLFPTEFSWPLVNVLVTAPLLEEFLMRGAVMENLAMEQPFWKANLVSSLMFVLLHVPGWLFMEAGLGGALPVFLISIVLGLAAHRSRSVLGGVIAHFLNNLFA